MRNSHWIVTAPFFLLTLLTITACSGKPTQPQPTECKSEQLSRWTTEFNHLSDLHYKITSAELNTLSAQERDSTLEEKSDTWIQQANQLLAHLHAMPACQNHRDLHAKTQSLQALISQRRKYADGYEAQFNELSARRDFIKAQHLEYADRDVEIAVQDYVPNSIGFISIPIEVRSKSGGATKSLHAVKTDFSEDEQGKSSVTSAVVGITASDELGNHYKLWTADWYKLDKLLPGQSLSFDMSMGQPAASAKVIRLQMEPAVLGNSKNVDLKIQIPQTHQ
jgi:hypothetical protein